MAEKAYEGVPESIFSTLITANHILYHNNVCDGFGHVSVRNPADPSTFFLSGSIAPALVSSLDDLIEYNVEDASPVRKDSGRGYAERFIHSEIYKKYTDVKSVVHGHAEAVVPFSITSVPLRPVFHMAGVVGPQVPIYEISNHYRASDTQHTLLVTNQHLGAGLAAAFAPSSFLSKTSSIIKNMLTSTPEAKIPFPPLQTVLMRGHGFTCVGTSIEEAVYRSVFLCQNARIQTSALLLQNAFNTQELGLAVQNLGRKADSPVQMQGLHHLSEQECRDAWQANQAHLHRPWRLWCAEVAQCSLYKNALGPPPGA